MDAGLQRFARSRATRAAAALDSRGADDRALPHALFQLPGANAVVLEQNPQIRAFPRSFLNSVIIAIGTTAICLVFGSISAYSLSRFVARRGRQWILLGLLASRMVPVVSVLIPIYIALQAMGLLNTLRGLILVYTGLLLPFVIWILEGFYRTFPIELEEAAIMDGCTPLGVFLRVVLPLSDQRAIRGRRLRLHLGLVGLHRRAGPDHLRRRLADLSGAGAGAQSDHRAELGPAQQRRAGRRAGPCNPGLLAARCGAARHAGRARSRDDPIDGDASAGLWSL